MNRGLLWGCHPGAALSWALVLFAPSYGAAQEKLLMDTGVVRLPHEPHIVSDDEYHHAWILPHFNWKSPVNYLDGTLYQYVEVFQRASTIPLTMEPILDETRNAAPGGDDPKALKAAVNGHHWGMRVAISKPGMYTKSSPLKSLRDATNLFTEARISNPPCLRLLIANQAAPGQNIPFSDLNCYPMTVRVIWVIVPPGATFSGWKNYAGSADPYGRYGNLHWRDLAELKSVATHLRAGSLGRALEEAERESESAKPERREEARRVLEALKAHAKNRSKELAELREESPDVAIQELASFAKRYLPSRIGTELQDEAKAWSADPELQKLRKAAAIFGAVQEAARTIDGKGKTTDPKFAARHPREIETIAAGARRLRKEYPETKLCGKALDIAGRMGIRLGDW